MLGLRKADGIDLAEFYRLFGHGLGEKARKEMDSLATAGLIKVKDGRVMLTIVGVLASNRVITEFF